MNPGALDCDPRVELQQGVVVESFEPRLDCRDPPGAADARCDGADDSCRAVGISGRVRVLERRFRLALGFEPVRGPLVEHRHKLRIAFFELAPEQVAEEPVVPVRAAVAIERDQEQVRLLDRGELQGRFLAFQDGIAERPGHRLQHRSAA